MDIELFREELKKRNIKSEHLNNEELEEFVEKAAEILKNIAKGIKEIVHKLWSRIKGFISKAATNKIKAKRKYEKRIKNRQRLYLKRKALGRV